MHYDSHQRPMTTGFALLPFAAYTQRTREERIELVYMTDQYSFLDGEGPMRNMFLKII